MPKTLGGQRERLGLIAIHRGMTAQPKAPAHTCLMPANSLSPSHTVALVHQRAKCTLAEVELGLRCHTARDTLKDTIDTLISFGAIAKIRERMAERAAEKAAEKAKL